VKLYRFVVGPKKYKIVYEPPWTFVEKVRELAADFAVKHGLWPNACYISISFSGWLPGPLLLINTGEPNDLETLRFRRQTLLGMDEILLGVEVEMDLWEEGDNEFSERAIG